jgi:hypothetical protein
MALDTRRRNRLHISNGKRSVTTDALVRAARKRGDKRKPGMKAWTEIGS